MGSSRQPTLDKTLGLLLSSSLFNLLLAPDRWVSGFRDSHSFLSQCDSRLHLCRSVGFSSPVDFFLSTLLKHSLVEIFSLFSGFRDRFVQLNPVDFLLLSMQLNSYYQHQSLGTLLEIMLAYEHLRTCIAHINLF
jgi:hypothetical protein